MEVGSCMGGISSWKVYSCISCHIHMPWNHLLRQDLRINPQFSKDKQDTSSRGWSFFLRVLRVICVLITSKTPIMCSWLVPTGAIIQNLFASLHTIKYKYCKCNLTLFAHSNCQWLWFGSSKTDRYTFKTSPDLGANSSPPGSHEYSKDLVGCKDPAQVWAQNFKKYQQKWGFPHLRWSSNQLETQDMHSMWVS